MGREGNNYEARLDKIFGNGTLWQHRTLRTILDPYSEEWKHTELEEKIEILKKIVNSGENLEKLVSNFKDRYEDQNRKDISASAEAALAIVLQFNLTE